MKVNKSQHDVVLHEPKSPSMGGVREGFLGGNAYE
jgi:hypothetical protein